MLCMFPFKKKNKDLDIIKNSSFFDFSWYKSTYPESKLNPVEHYYKIGWKKGFCPSPRFDGNKYLEVYKDVKDAGMNPLLHYELYGKYENRSIDFTSKVDVTNNSVLNNRLGKEVIYSSLKEDVPDLDLLKKIISQDSIDVVSFDIFDTLIVRPVVEPTDIFYLLDKKLKKEYNIDFINYRLNAERELGNPLASLDEIYEFIQEKYKLSSDEISLMKKEETSCEKQLCFRRDDIFELYKFALEHNKKIIAISDMYLSSEVLNDILLKNGYNKIEKVYVSNECKSRKDTGALYKYVKKNEENLSIVHIGDNYESDYKKAIESNILAIYYPSIKNVLFKDNSIFNKVWSVPNISPDPICRILLGYTLINNFKNLSEVKDHASIYADFSDFIKLSIAPFIFYLSAKIGNSEIIQNKYKNVYFASRDGFLPNIGYCIYSKFKKCIPSKYFYAGRRAYFSSQFETFLDYFNSIKRSDDLVFTLNQLIDSLIFDKDLVNVIKAQLSSDELSLDFNKDKTLIISILERFNKELSDYMENHKKESQNYYKYIFKNEERVVVFDCGYSGSISVALSKILNKKVDKIYLWEEKANKIKDSKNGTTTYLLLNEYRLFLSQNLIYEEIFSPIEGGCLSFKNNHPILEEIEINSKMKEKYSIIEEDVKSYMENICNHFKSYLPYMNLYDTCTLQKLLDFAFTKSPFCELDLLDNIDFPDPLENDSVSLADKVQKFIPYENVFAMTGFYNPANKIQNPCAKVTRNDYKIGIHIHLYHIFLYNEFISYLKDFPQKFDLIITICDDAKLNLLNNIFTKEILPNMNKLIIKISENRGRDIAPWLIETKNYQNDYDLFCHVQSKISTHLTFGNQWRKYLLKNILSHDSFAEIVNLFLSNEKLGICFPEVFPFLKYFCIKNKVEQVGMFGEIKIINSLLKKMNFDETLTRKDLFFSEGSMFWYRPKALHQLFDLNLKYEDFPPEPIGVGGTIAHAIERLPAFLTKLNGYEAKEFTYFYKN